MAEPYHGGTDSQLMGLLAECTPDEAAREFSTQRRSVRIHGHSTSIRLEKAFWEVLEQIAKRDGISLATLIATVHDHCQQIDTRNLASCLRVVCLRSSGADAGG